MSQIKSYEVSGDVAVSRHATVGGDTTVRGHFRAKRNLKVEGWLDAPNVRHPHKGMFMSGDDLKNAYPHPVNGWWATVGTSLPGKVWIVRNHKWEETSIDGPESRIDISEWAQEILSDALDDKIASISNSLNNNIETLRNECGLAHRNMQENERLALETLAITLREEIKQSKPTLKTINGESIVGTGDIKINSGIRKVSFLLANKVNKDNLQKKGGFEYFDDTADGEFIDNAILDNGGIVCLEIMGIDEATDKEFCILRQPVTFENVGDDVVSDNILFLYGGRIFTARVRIEPDERGIHIQRGEFDMTCMYQGAID